ncbi:hypothetical protein B0T14DRAFT_116494 [Immersiella caudata]|uniref:Uncharacterized protein n=1 Tax=Immersiella caudata TaxID=314043 RepID=A0AA39X3X5_9PEZI|nr:hypothetical protein B0T14DRAFT_116494 [Immersiella caudata]
MKSWSEQRYMHTLQHSIAYSTVLVFVFVFWERVRFKLSLNDCGVLLALYSGGLSSTVDVLFFSVFPVALTKAYIAKVLDLRSFSLSTGFFNLTLVRLRGQSRQRSGLDHWVEWSCLRLRMLGNLGPGEERGVGRLLMEWKGVEGPARAVEDENVRWLRETTGDT